MKVWSIFTMTLALLLAAGALGADGAGSSASTGPSADVKPSNDIGPRHRRAGNTAEQDWSEMMDFMKANSPNRYKILNDPKFKKESPLGADLMNRFQDYRQLNEHFPDLGKVRAQRFQAEDQLFDLSMQLKKDPTQVESLRPKIHDTCSNLISLDIQERQLRIQHLQEQKDKEQKALDDEKANVDSLADAQAQKVIDQVSSGKGGHHGQHHKNQEPGASPESGGAPQSRPSGDSTGTGN